MLQVMSIWKSAECQALTRNLLKGIDYEKAAKKQGREL